LVREVAYKQSGWVHNRLRLFKKTRGRTAPAGSLNVAFLAITYTLSC
jgi:hypothetical protein